LRIRRLSELNEEDVLKPKPRQKLNAKKEKLADSISESIQMQHETQSINTLLKEKPQFKILTKEDFSEKNSISTFTPVTVDNLESSIDQNSIVSNKTKTNSIKKGNGFFLETIDRLVDSNGSIIAKNETVKYLGKASSEKSKRHSLADAVSKRDKTEYFSSSGSTPSSPSKTKRENFSIKLPGINNKSLKELNNEDLEEIAYVIRHHEKGNSRPYKNNYYFNGEEIYPDGPLRKFLDSIKDEDMGKFEIEAVKKKEVSNEIIEKKVKKEESISKKEDDGLLVNRVRIINIPKRTMHSNQHFMVDIDNDTVLASELDQKDLDKIVKAIQNHRPDIRTKTSRYFLNSQEILPRGILRKYFDEYEDEELRETVTGKNTQLNKNLKPDFEIEAPLKVKIMNKPLDLSEAFLNESRRRDFLCFLVGEGDNKRSLRELNEGEINRLATAIGKHWPKTRTDESKFFFHKSQIYPNVVEDYELAKKEEPRLSKPPNQVNLRESQNLNDYQFDDVDKANSNQIYLELDNTISKVPIF
jgi:hypothetical protein